MSIVQHNWTGPVAVHASFTPQAVSLAQPVKGVNPSKTHPCWLKAAAHARLRLHGSSDSQPCSLSLHLQDHLLMQQPLDDASLKLALLPCQQTSVLLLLPMNQEPSPAVPVSYCFAFLDDLDCNSFTAALQAMLDRQQQARHLAQQHTGQQQDRGAAAVQQQQQQQQAVAGPVVPGQAAAEAPPADSAADGLALQAEAKAAVKRFLLDPDFQRLVDYVDAIWDEVEAEVV